MGRNLATLFVAVCLLAAVPHYLEKYQAASKRNRAAADAATSLASEPPAASVAVAQINPAIKPPSGRIMQLEADPSGHFRGDFRINGMELQGLVDTGATYVALNMATARRLGVHLAQSDFIHPVMTANGETKAAVATLDRVEIGNIRVTRVDAVVLSDDALQNSLIGMSFLNRLASYKVEGRTLTLKE